MRGKIVLFYLKGINKSAIAKALSIGCPTVYLWIRRSEKDGIQGILHNASRLGRKKQIDEEKEKQITRCDSKDKAKMSYPLVNKDNGKTARRLEDGGSKDMEEIQFKTAFSIEV